MKKKSIIRYLLVFVLIVTALPIQTVYCAPSADTQSVNPTASTVYVNSTARAFEAYNIEGYNYFKLRDLALVLSGTQKQFAVGYNEETRAITITIGNPYTVIGGEMAQGDGKPKDAIPTPSTIYLNGAVLDLVVYNIGGNNFFKLRDLMEAIDVYVGYDFATNAVSLDTSRGYVAEESNNPLPVDWKQIYANKVIELINNLPDFNQPNQPWEEKPGDFVQNISKIVLVDINSDVIPELVVYGDVSDS